MILLNATDISKSYTASPLLSKLSYAINEGDKIGLIGVNGTGKSTLLRITAGVEEADSGRIVLTGGVRIGYLPQAPAYDPDKTVLEQAVSYLTRETAAEGEYKCKSMLNQLGITDFEKKMSTLSGGERKRVAMAGIFTNECDILILDEQRYGRMAGKLPKEVPRCNLHGNARPLLPGSGHKCDFGADRRQTLPTRRQLRGLS
mgnify:CR=1 FL=1